MKETLKVFTVNHRHGWRGSFAKCGTDQSRKPLVYAGESARWDVPAEGV